MTTPEEYDRQHYEGGTTLFGRAEGVFIQERLAELVRRLVRGRPRAGAGPVRPPQRRAPTTPPRFGPGAAARPDPRPAAATSAACNGASFRWSGGPRGRDRPLDRAFVTVQRRAGGGWRKAADDLGLQILWTVD